MDAVDGDGEGPEFTLKAMLAWAERKVAGDNRTLTFALEMSEISSERSAPRILAELIATNYSSRLMKRGSSS